MLQVTGQQQTTNVRLVDGENGVEPQMLLIDDVTGALAVIPTVHHEVPEGEMFTTSYFLASIADDATIMIRLLTGATKFAHLTFFVSCGADAQIELLENPTIDTPGTELVEYNNKRTSSESAEVQAFHTPTITGGTVLLTALLPGGTGGNSSGGLLRANTEFNLKQEEDYVIRLTNIGGNNQPVSIIATWYEESSN